MDAGTKETYERIKQTPNHAWEQVCEGIGRLTDFVFRHRLRNDICWKMLILPDSYREIHEGCKIAANLGCRYVQIRPADLPEDERRRIKPEYVEAQVHKAIADFEKKGVFEIVGVRHKFTPDLRAVLPKYCYMTPLTVTVTSDGKVYACVDRRCDKSTCIADCGRDGWVALEKVWGSPEHVRVVHDVINRGGAGPDCSIRCSNYGYDDFFLNYFVEDNTDRNLI
jgi:hypothetical protein